MGITHEEIFENMLRSMRFGVYFERILKMKWLFSYRNNSYTHICFRGSGAHVTRENYENIVQFGVFWCIFDQIWCLEEFPKNLHILDKK